MITRTINGIEIDIDETKPDELYFPADFIDSIDGFSGEMDQIKQGIYQWNGKCEYIPLSIMWEQTNSCTFSCPFCYINSPGATRYPFYSIQELESMIDSLVDHGMLFCTISGGECLMQPDFPEIYCYLKKKGVIVSVFTNGLLISDNLLEAFRCYKPYKVEVSIYGVTDEGFKRATNTSYSYKVVLNNVLRLKKMGIDVRCKTPITSLTSTEIPAIREWCMDNNIYYYVSDELFDSYYGESVDAYRINDAVFKSAVKEREEAYRKRENHIWGRKIAWNCSAGKYAGVISGDRAFYPCMTSITTGKYRYPLSEGLGKAIEDYKRDLTKEKGRELDFCKGCSICNICEKCVLSTYIDSSQQLLEHCEYMQKFY